MRKWSKGMWIMKVKKLLNYHENNFKVKQYYPKKNMILKEKIKTVLVYSLNEFLILKYYMKFVVSQHMFL